MSGEQWAGVPVAWAAVAENGQPMWLGYDRPVDTPAVPLYRHPQPTLTDAEREAVEEAAGTADDAASFYSGKYHARADAACRLAATLRGLLERLGGDE